MSRERIGVTIPLSLVVLVLCVLAGMWLYKNFEYKDVEEWTNYSKKARLNDFLAAEYFFKELGFDVESSGDRSRLLREHQPDEVIILNDYGPNLSPSRYEQLKNWLANGGHLIFEARDYFDEELLESGNQILDEYNIRLHYSLFDFDSYQDNDEDDDVTSYINSYTLPSGEEIDADFYFGNHLLDEDGIATLSLASEYGVHLLQFPVGNGLVTVTSDSDFIQNWSIKENDHAYLLWWLITKGTDNPNLLLLYDVASDSLFGLLWKHAQEACIALLIFTVVFLWSLRNRLGPMLLEKNTAMRDISEHFKAVGRFSWREDKAGLLLNETRKECEYELTGRYPVMRDMSENERCEYLAKILDVPYDYINEALYKEVSSTNEFIRFTYHLQKLRTI